VRFLLRAVLSGVALSVVALLLALLLALWAALDSAPSITDAQAVISTRSAERAAKRLGELDPRRLRDGERRSIVLATDEVQALLQIAAKRLPDTRAQAVSVDGQMNLRTATALPGKLWLNIDAPVVVADGEPRLDGLQIGSLSLPAPIARTAFAAALPWLLRQFGYGGDPALLSEVVHGARISRDSLRIDYALSRQVAAEGMRALLPAGEAGRLSRRTAHGRTRAARRRRGARRRQPAAGVAATVRTGTDARRRHGRRTTLGPARTGAAREWPLAGHAGARRRGLAAGSAPGTDAARP
jgi:hypothetical protein